MSEYFFLFACTFYKSDYDFFYFFIYFFYVCAKCFSKLEFWHL